jgi:hypothetical protein
MMTSPDGRETKHSPPDAMTTRSKRAGPKNQLVNISHTAVSIAQFISLLPVRVLGGLVNQEKRNITEVHAHAFFKKYTLRKLDLLAK